MLTHFCISLEGALRWPKREFNRSFKNCVKDDKGRVMTPEQVRVEFEALRAKGVKVIPCGDCDNFDDQRGCLGHPDTADKLTADGEGEMCKECGGCGSVDSDPRKSVLCPTCHGNGQRKP